MHFDSLNDFWAMGGHGFYVWLAYGLTFLIILANVIQPILRNRQLIKEQRQRLKREQGAASIQGSTEDSTQGTRSHEPSEHQERT